MPDSFIDDERNPFDPEVIKEAEALRERAMHGVENDKRAWLERRKHAYWRVFAKGTPERADREIVYADLAAFCRLHDSTFHENDRIHALLEGRHEVVLRIMDHLRLDPDQLLAKYDMPLGKDDGNV